MLLATDGSTDATAPGALVDHGDGTYTYTFYTDLTDTAVTCPAPCIDAQGNPLDTSYQPTYTHRVGIYTRSPLPTVNGIYDFRPDGNVVTLTREIVATAKCNECHNKLNHHGGRTDTRFCVTCHNPGSWDSASGNTVDFKVMVHKIHRSENLPSVVAGGTYAIGSDDFSDIAFPQEIRNCTKCHDGTSGAANATTEGDNWKTGLSMAACGSCHDNIDFSQDGSLTYTTTPVASRTAHSGGVMTDNSQCITCHVSGKIGRSVEEDHNITNGQFIAKVERDKFKFNILKICGTAVASNPAKCAPGTIPTVTFSVTDPSGGTHGYPNSTYNIFSDPEFWASGAAVGRISVDIAWDTRDYNNAGGYAARPARANQINVYGGSATTNYGFASVQLPLYPAATDNGDGTYTVTDLEPIPDSTVFPNLAAAGSGAVAIEGRAVGAPLTTIPATTAGLRLPIKADVAYFGITDTVPVERRVVVDAATKCDNCHDQLSLHGGSRNDNVQLCVFCHNPNNTDVQNSSRVKFANGLSKTAAEGQTALDGKKEESIDLKRMIHGIHAAGYRTNGIVVSGTDFGDVRFPGILNDCSACHTTKTISRVVYGTYELTDIWEQPTLNNILASTIDSTPGLAEANSSSEVNASLQNPVDDLNISPIAAVCSSCHDTVLQKSHMISNGAVFDQTQTVISASVIETCPVCHGPGAVEDVKVVHAVP